MLSLMILLKLKAKLLKVTDDGEAMTILSEFLDNVTNRDAIQAQDIGVDQVASIC